MLKTIGIGFAVALSVTAGAFSAAALREDVTARKPVVAAADRDLHVGAQYAYEVSTARTIADETGKEITKTTIGGTLVLTVVGKAAEGVAVHAELRYPSRVDAPAITSSARELGAAFFLVVRPDASIASYGFAKDTSPEARRHLRSIVAALELGKAGADAAKEEAFVGRVLTTRVRVAAHFLTKAESHDLDGSYDAARSGFDADGETR